MKIPIGGWKSIAGAVLIALGSVAKALPYEWAEPAGQLMTQLGAALLGIGIAHKIVKGPAV